MIRGVHARRNPRLRFLAIAFAATLIAPAGAIAQTSAGSPSNPDAFGDIFVHPRDRYYMPGQAPSRATLDSSTVVRDGRGQVNRYEYTKGKTVISRETWQDDRGESQGRIGIGKKF